MPLVEDVRKLLSNYQPDEFTLLRLSKDLDQPLDALTQAFGNESGLVEEILDYEQQNLENIFKNFDFKEGNAIDSLLKASKEISKKYMNIQPSINFDLRVVFPEIRQKFVEKRVQFVHAQIKTNFEMGICQGLYRPDLSAELVSRIYVSRLIDLHNPDYFPNETISFHLLFDVMFDTFIRGICTEEGRFYYEKKVKSIKF